MTRVTNEQIDAVLICHRQMQCSECKYDKTLDDCQPTQEQFAADLLDSRTIIEKQTVLIKEMRSKLLIGGMQATSDMKMFRSIPVDSGIIADLIKRTKDYA